MKTRSSVLVWLVVVTAACGESDLAQRQREVARAGTEVMPFDLGKTTHVFEKLERGGLQTVLADQPDTVQVQLIRAHLSEEAARFSRGDFHDPAMIHGADMAGLHTLATRHDQLVVTYRDVDLGGQIEYESLDPAVVAAVHEWFDAQLQDHGDHAQPRR